MRRLLAAVAALTSLGAGAGSASAAELLSTTVTASDAVKRSCIERQLAGGRGYATRSTTAPDAGWITARLAARSGDWDLAVFNSATGERVAGSTLFGAGEIAEGFVGGGERLAVQACRRSGAAASAKLTVESTAVQRAEPVKLSLVRVVTPNADRKAELDNLGLDLTEHGGAGFVEVLLHGARDARTLREAKFLFSTEIADLAAVSARDRRAERRAAVSAGMQASGLPSGRTGTYRRLDDYNDEMKTLAEENPRIVKPITLPFKTFEGRTVHGIEISERVRARDGKPVFLNMGVHHAREWPSGEHAIEWAYELVNGYKANDSRVRDLMSRTRTIVIPIVNPDGFNTSREAGERAGVGAGRPGGGAIETANLATPYEYHRKNCRINNTAEDDFASTEDDDPAEGDCLQPGRPNSGLTQFGVDPNRNYGGFWGGPGASPSGEAPAGDFAQTYRGNGPFSEPETQNVRELVSERQVTTLITNHTFSNLILRPPGTALQGPSVDEPVYKALGRSMAVQNGYKNQLGYRLYDTSGTTEDWSYYATGGLGFTFEIGASNFHPEFAATAAQYDGTSQEATAIGGGGNREAYFKALENTANPERHSVISGDAPPGAILRLRKSFKTSTAEILDADDEKLADPILFPDELETTMEVPSSGSFEWHVNPSTRPIAAQPRGRPATGSPSPPIETTNNAPPVPPCPAYFELGSDACPPTSYDDIPFTVPENTGGVDNGSATIAVNWATTESDYDLEIYHDFNGDGDLDDTNADNEPESDPIGASTQGGTDSESTTIGPDPAPGKYFARVINWAAGEPYDFKITFNAPEPFKPGTTETWTLTCEGVDGTVASTREVLINRGQVKTESFGAGCARVAAAAIERRDCLPATGGVKPGRRSVGKVKLGRTRDRQRRILGGRRLKSRRGIDRYCVRGGGGMRVGYPTKRLASKISKRSRKRVRRRAVLAITSSRRFKIRRSRVGTRVKVLRKRLEGERRLRVGRNVWFTVRGKKSRLLFATRRGRVRQVGLGDAALTSTRRGTQRFLRAWDKRGL